ncbi:MAG: hypothetical protein PHC68_00385 [Syntrophorhabdaceae bacterium]|nr:hypothetical protein [Syntrophorhabdaceae bacterium]
MIKLLFLILFIPCLAFAQESAYQFTLGERPYTDKDGKVLQSIEGRFNRKGVDEFFGSGKFYPDYTKAKIKERHEKGITFLLVVDNPSTALESQGKKLTKEEAKVIKELVFGISEKEAESGVTP